MWALFAGRTIRLREEVMRQAAAVGIAFAEKPEDRQQALEGAVPAPELPFADEGAEEAPERVAGGFVQEQWWPEPTVD